MNSSEQRWFEVWQIAQRLRVGHDTVYRLIKRGALKALRIYMPTGRGRRKKCSWRIREDWFDQFIRANS